jgi:hypothetical protein
MEEVLEKTFGPGENVELGGKKFVRCNFNGCNLIYRGEVLNIENCQFNQPHVRFSDAAFQTIQFLGFLSRQTRLSVDQILGMAPIQ